VLCPHELATRSLLLSRRAVEVILWELLENSAKFHPSQSPAVEVAVLSHDTEQVCLRVTDNGVTISPEHLGRVWTPYYQGEKYFTGEAKGMGLGLPTVAAFVWEVGGACQISNREDGAGVVVELTIPTGGGSAQAGS
jgi:K+-sensing histidine kinase KdpD